jgi:hypothetical protein
VNSIMLKGRFEHNIELFFIAYLGVSGLVSITVSGISGIGLKKEFVVALSIGFHNYCIAPDSFTPTLDQPITRCALIGSVNWRLGE